MKTFFISSATAEHRLLVVFILSLTLMVVEHRLDALGTVRLGLSYIVAPVHFLVDWPFKLGKLWSDHFIDRPVLLEENRRLEQKNLILQRRVQQMSALAAENIRLRALLNSSILVEESVLVAEVIGVDPNPYNHEIVLNRGIHGGVRVGQAVLDARGLMGQVIKAEAFTSRVMLITDSNHALPVQINRNGVRAVAVGRGFLNKLYLNHLPDTTDIKVGDLLVSSGLGGRFPFGYPVAEVMEVTHDPGKPFAEVVAAPKSKLNRVRHVLLIMKQDVEPLWHSLNVQQQHQHAEEPLDSSDKSFLE